MSAADADTLPLDIRHLGRQGYVRTLALQHELVEARADGSIGDTLLLVEHEAVYTVGRRRDAGNPPPTDDTPVHVVERGGDVTWHGPGQLVGYWIRRLEGAERDLHRHLRHIEGALIDGLAELAIAARPEPGLTGVWVGPLKIASVGVAVRRWVTFHGFALNVAVDPGVFRGFRPCGLSGDVMTDVAAHSPTKRDMDEVTAAVGSAFKRRHARRHGRP